MIWGIDENKEKIKATISSKAKCDICETELIPKCGVIKIWHWSHKSLVDCDSWVEPESKWHLNWKDEFSKECQEITIKKCISDYCNNKKYNHNHNGKNHGDCIDCEFILHRADIKTKEGLVLEIQNSPISPDDICDREEFYGNMIWLLNGETIGKNLELRDKKTYLTFSWKNPPKSWFYSERDIYIDMEYQIEEIAEMIEDNENRLHIVFKELKKLINEDPNKFDFTKYEYSHYLDEEEIKIKEVYDLWHDISMENSSLENRGDFFKGNTIFYIKKLYGKIPCAGWGYLISKEEFLRRVKK